MEEKDAAKKKQQKPKQQQPKQQQPKHQQQQPKHQQKHHHQQQQQSEKKKNQENRVKIKQSWLIPPNIENYGYHKRKNKRNENNFNSNHNYNKSSKKKSASPGRSFLWVFASRLSFVLLFLGFIYVVDYERFVKLRDGASSIVNKTASLLPPEVLKKGKEAVELVQPLAEATLNKVNLVTKETSNFLNTNPLIKDHWTNIREISSICSARLADYMRLVYAQATGYCNNVKNKLFN